MEPNSSKPLEGILVIDATLGLAGSVSTMLMASLGADVRRTAQFPQYRDYAPDGAGPLVWHRKKTPVESDSEARKLLAEAALVVMTPDLEGAPAYDVEELRSNNPELVVVSIVSGLAQGSQKVTADCDILAQANTGLMGEQGGVRPKGPTMHDAPLPSYGAAYIATASAMAALYKAKSQGKGSHVEVNLRAGVHAFIGWHWIDAEKPDARFLKMNTEFPYHICQAKGGDWLHLHPGADGAPQRIHKALGLDPEEILKAAPMERMFGFLETWRTQIRQRDRDDVLKALWDVDVPAQPTMAPGEAFDDEQVESRGYIEEWETSDHGALNGIGSAILVKSFSGSEPPELRSGSNGAAGEKPLANIRVVDMSIFVAGTFGSMLLADLGADVIKVEPPQGEPGRLSNSIFSAVNRGKRSLVLDLKSEEGIEKIKQLIKTADVFHHNMRPGTLERLGLGHETLQEIRPGIVICDMSGYGQTGPRAQWPGFDQLFQALCGFEYAGGGEGNSPIWYRTGFVDICAGMMAAAGVASALVHRVQARPQYSTIDVSLLGAALTTRSECARLKDGSFLDRPKLDADQTGYGPFYSIYPTKDEWIAISATNESGARSLLEILALDSNSLQCLSSALTDKALKQSIASSLLKKTCAEWIGLFERAGIPCARVRQNMEETTLNSTQLADEDEIFIWNHPDLGRVRQLGALVRFDGQPLVSPLAPPELGAHSKAVLSGIG